MTRAQRTLLFIVLGVLFLGVAGILLPYSQGYRLDLTEGKITQAGAFYFKVQPKSVAIYVNDKLIKRTDFLFGSALTKSFFPAVYHVRIEKDGYHPWEKALRIEPKIVTEAKNVILFPTTTEFQLITDKVYALWPSPDGTQFILQKETLSKKWALVLFDAKTESEKTIFTQQTSTQDILHIEWYPNSQEPTLLFQLNAGEQIKTYVYQLNKQAPCNIAPCLLDIGDNGIGSVTFSINSAESILFTQSIQNTEVLLRTSFLEPESTFQIIADDVVAFLKQGDSILWIDSAGEFWKKNLITSDRDSLSFTAFPIQTETKYALFGNEKTLFLQEEDTLYRLKSGNEAAELIFENIGQLTYSPDGRYIAIAASSEIWLYFLENQTVPIQRQVGDRVFLNRFGADVANLSWLSAHYLIFSVGEIIKTIEIDTRDTLNSIDIALYKKPTLFWEGNRRILYVLSEQRLSVSETLAE